MYKEIDMGRTKSLFTMAMMMAMIAGDDKIFGIPRSMKISKPKPVIPAGMKMWRFSDGDKVIAKNFREANEIHKRNKKR